MKYRVLLGSNYMRLSSLCNQQLQKEKEKKKKTVVR